MSLEFPSNVTIPVVAYFAVLGFVPIERSKESVICLFVLFCSSSFALTSKKSFSEGEYSLIFSPWRLLIRMETVTPETEYFGQMSDSPHWPSSYRI